MPLNINCRTTVVGERYAFVLLFVGFPKAAAGPLCEPGCSTSWWSRIVITPRRNENTTLYLFVKGNLISINYWCGGKEAGLMVSHRQGGVKRHL